MHQVKPSQSTVTLIACTKLIEETLPTELMPVLAARVSHGQDGKTGKDAEKDEKLIRFLAEHRHTSPFEHLSLTFKIEAPIFVAREWMRHRTQSFNEISMRYTSDYIGEVYYPNEYRKQDDKNRQVGLGELDADTSEAVEAILTLAYKDAVRYYDMLLEQGLCREQARLVIPVGHMTHFYATANLLNWAKFCKLRQAEDAQFEIRELADKVDAAISDIYPLPWKYLNG
jgi:thymidylate synthase (FAD)